MRSATIRSKRQLTVPRSPGQSPLSEDDQAIVREEAGRIVTCPARVVPAGQGYFWTPQWQAKEVEAAEDVAEGRVSETFEDGEALLAHLHGKTK